MEMRQKTSKTAYITRTKSYSRRVEPFSDWKKNYSWKAVSYINFGEKYVYGWWETEEDEAENVEQFRAFREFVTNMYR